MAPRVIYRDDGCPHGGCGRILQAIDFRLEQFGPIVHDPLVRAWWDDVGFAGQCPACRRWIHFTIHGKRAMDAAEPSLPQLPVNWADEAAFMNRAIEGDEAQTLPQPLGHWSGEAEIL